MGCADGRRSTATTATTTTTSSSSTRLTRRTTPVRRPSASCERPTLLSQRPWWCCRSMWRLVGLGATHFAVERCPRRRRGQRRKEHGAPKRGHEEWLAAIAAHDDDIARIRGQIINFTPPPDPPLVAAMRGTSRGASARAAEARRPARARGGSMRAIRRWKEEQVALAQAGGGRGSAGAPGAGAREALAT